MCTVTCKRSYTFYTMCRGFLGIKFKPLCLQTHGLRAGQDSAKKAIGFFEVSIGYFIFRLVYIPYGFIFTSTFCFTS